MRAIDTNALVRLIARDDPDQIDRAEAFVEPGAWVSHIVLAETVWVLASVYRLQAGQIAQVVAMLLEHERLVVQDSDVVRAALELFQGQVQAGFADCLIVATARKAGHQPIGTFDKAMADLPGASGM